MVRGCVCVCVGVCGCAVCGCVVCVVWVAHISIVKTKKLRFFRIWWRAKKPVVLVWHFHGNVMRTTLFLQVVFFCMHLTHWAGGPLFASHGALACALRAPARGNVYKKTLWSLFCTIVCWEACHKCHVLQGKNDRKSWFLAECHMSFGSPFFEQDCLKFFFWASIPPNNTLSPKNSLLDEQLFI